MVNLAFVVVGVMGDHSINEEVIETSCGVNLGATFESGYRPHCATKCMADTAVVGGVPAPSPTFGPTSSAATRTKSLGVSFSHL